MPKEKIFKCAFKHCRHSSCDVSQGEAVKIGRRYYHRDCADTRNDIEIIKNLYCEKISNTVVIPLLLSVIDNIVFQKEIDSAYLLFALRFAITNKIVINSPYGLHYIIDNYKIKNAWSKHEARKITNIHFEAKAGDEPVFQVKNTVKKGLDNLFD